LNCDEYATGKGWVESEEAFHDFAGLGIKDSDSWAAAEACACDEVCNAIAIKVT